MAEVYEHEAGRIIIGHSDEELSIGLLILNPQSRYVRHNRPVKEQLTQAHGSCTMELIENGKQKSVVLNAGDTLEIPANQFHTHTNPNDETSVTMWKFEGDITQVIDGIRKSMKKV
ncbi:hypothetical protein EPN87_01560 [archaeon]|nr:MAG: hypothetical protein EPN87_01560 [archaeon]